MKITQREMILGIVTIGCVLIGGTWYGVNGKIVKWKAMKPRITQLRDQIVRHETAIRMQDSWSDELHELEQGLRIFSTEQRSAPTADLMKTINTISDKYELEITRSNPYGEKPTGDLFELGINCTWQGTLDSLVDFLTEMQQQGIRYDIRTLNIQPVGKNTGKLKGNIVINCAYTRRPNGGDAGK